MKFLQSEDWLEPAISIAGHLPARKSWLDRFATLMKKAYPALSDKNLAAFTDGHKNDYARPLQLFKRHLDSAKVFDDTIQAVFIRNERPVADAFRDAARQINAINDESNQRAYYTGWADFMSGADWDELRRRREAWERVPHAEREIRHG